MVYKVTQSSRGRSHERRVEITSTYSGNLEEERGYTDVVLGYEPSLKVFVGLDPIRLRHGGETSNASSFLEVAGLQRTPAAPFAILVRQTSIFPEGESQAFFRPERIGEYLLNVAAIHSGAYRVAGVSAADPLDRNWSKRPLGKVALANAKGTALTLERAQSMSARTIRLTNRAIDAADDDQQSYIVRNLTPAELRAILQRQEENGYLGEQFVYEYEKTALRAAGRQRLAKRVEWTSQRVVGAGYDISSFDPKTGTARYIEVKSCSRINNTFNTSLNEWRSAKKHGNRYYIYRVINVRSNPTINHKLMNPVKLESEGALQISESGWTVTIIKKKT